MPRAGTLGGPVGVGDRETEGEAEGAADGDGEGVSTTDGDGDAAVRTADEFVLYQTTTALSTNADASVSTSQARRTMAVLDHDIAGSVGPDPA
ncbi:hypothetical protein GCM10022255_024430 [Dactylosporangium darangshiense]|uniref:Uncharacterized protein n=1 Tax=Dactylosporangium darangshiense TaxID=579108 RepID=A0ABP8D528_9ACTN